MKLDGKTAVVTGGAVRIGQAIALALAEQGCSLLIHYHGSEAEALATRDRVSALGGRAAICQADLTDPAAAAKVLSYANEALGPVDILVNSAAIFLPGDMTRTTLPMWDEQFAINLRAPFLLCQSFAAQLPPDRQGRIVNISDARVFRPASDHFAYRLTKAALLAMTEALALELAPRITVNAVALGAILPPPNEDERHLLALAQAQVPLRRPGNSQIVAENVLHLLRQDFLTGTTIRIDGGQFL
jgi:glucose 1-dehydrogenase